MIENIVHTALILALLLVLPGIMKEYDPPDWIKLAILIPGILGAAIAFFGGIVLVWMK